VTDHQRIYLEGRDRISNLVLALDAGAEGAPVPACPGWTLRDAVAHVTGIMDDSLAGNLEGVGSDAWTRAQIAKRAGRSVEQIVEEWRDLCDQAAVLFETLPPPVTQSLVGDLTTHEHDIRGGLVNRDARDTDSVDLALDWYARSFTKRVLDAGLPMVKVVAGEREWTRGDDAPTLAVTGSPFELLRSLTGRRTADEVAALEWSGDPSAYVPLASAYGWPVTSLGE